MSGGRTLHVRIAVDHVHLIVGSQNRKKKRKQQLRNAI